MFAKILIVLFTVLQVHVATASTTVTASATKVAAVKIGTAMTATNNLHVAAVLASNAANQNVLITIPGDFTGVVIGDLVVQGGDAAVAAATAAAASGVFVTPAATHLAVTKTELKLLLISAAANDTLPAHVGVKVTKGKLLTTYCNTDIVVELGTNASAATPAGFASLATPVKGTVAKASTGECTHCADAVVKTTPTTGTAAPTGGCFCGNIATKSTKAGAICAAKQLCKVTRAKPAEEQATDTFACNDVTTTASNAVVASISTVMLLMLAVRNLF